MQSTTSNHPVEFDVEYPERRLNRVSTLFRLVFALPILVVLAALGGPAFGGGGGDWLFFVGLASGMLVIPPMLTIVFREKYPRWWFDWNLELLRFINRVGVYFALMDDRYPSTDDHQAVRLELPEPAGLNRWLPLVKWFLAIPHYIVLFFLYIGAFFVVIAAWFAILFTGRYPRGLFDYLVGVGRWHNRVVGYAFILVTDRYPPFQMAP